MFISTNKSGSERVAQYWGAFVQPLLQWKSNKYYVLKLTIDTHLMQQFIYYYK